MNEQELRAMVRESIARALGAQQPDHARAPLVLTGHCSHHRYTLQESDGPCLIEPAVQCNHCGYCQSHGH